MFEQDDLIELFNDSCSVKTLTTKSVLTFTSKPTRTNDHRVVMDVLPRYDLQAAHMESQIFIGDNGEVTDYFLEVMKRDPSMSEAFQASSTAVVPADHTTAHRAGGGKIDDRSRYSSILANNREINQLLQREIDQRSGTSVAAADHATGRNDGATQENDDCLRFNKTVAESISTKIMMHDNSSCPPVHSQKHSMNVRSPVIDKDCIHIQHYKPKHRLVKKQPKSTRKMDDSSTKSPSYMSPKSPSASTTAVVASLDMMESSPAATMDLDAETSRTMIRSLELRLKGQLRTIKTLETQLHESRLLVDSKNKQLTTLQHKLKTSSLSLSPGSTEDAVVSSGAAGHSSPMVALRSALLRSEELTAQYKVVLCLR